MQDCRLRKRRMNENFVRAIEIDWSRVAEESYLRGIGALNRVERVEFTAPVTFFVGENGSGKSTLLEAMAIACGFNPEGGTRNYRFSTFDSHSELSAAVRVIRGVRRERHGYFLRAESFYNVATQEAAYAETPELSMRYHERSHGESFLALAQRELKPNGLYFLDEPEAALSPERQLTLLSMLAECKGAQFAIVTHSPILLALPGAEILNFDFQPLKKCEYEETGSYRIMEMFINHRATMLKTLLE